MTDSQRILDAIRRLVRMLRVSDRSAQSHLGISGAQLFVLRELGNSPGLSLNELATRTRTDQSSVSVVVGRLFESGLLTRERDDRDARRLILNLTPRGRSLIAQAPRTAQEQLLEVFDGMAPADRKRFAEEFEELFSKIGAAKDGAAPMLLEDDPDQEPFCRPRRWKLKSDLDLNPAATTEGFLASTAGHTGMEARRSDHPARCAESPAAAERCYPSPFGRHLQRPVIARCSRSHGPRERRAASCGHSPGSVEGNWHSHAKQSSQRARTEAGGR